MFFDLNPAPTFRTTVYITQPGGGHRALDVVFRHKKRSELNTFLANREQTDEQMVEEIVESVPEMPEGMTRDRFFQQLFENFPASASDLYATYVRELQVARLKN